MQKFRVPEIVLGALLATIFWAAVLGWQASYAPSDPQKDACYQAAAKSGRSTSECETFWEKTTSEPVALFTLVLAFSTVGLWVATIGLYFAGERQLRLAKEISDRQAADIQEQIALARNEFISSHRPRIIVYGLDYIGGAPESDDVEGPIKVCFRYVNSGDSLAKVKEVGTKLVHLFKPTMPTGLKFEVEKVVPPVEVKSGRHGSRLTVDAFEQEKFIFSSARSAYSLVCVGYIVYSDESGTDRQMGFCRKYDGESHRWLPMNDPEYEYSY